MRKLNARKVQFPCGSCKVGCQLTSKSLLCEAANTGFAKLKEATIRESLLLGDDRFAGPSPHVSSEISKCAVDDVAKDILSQFHMNETVGEPLQTTGDGDCLFNAVSILLSGNESQSLELRYKTALMMIKEESTILGHKDKASIMLLSPDFKEAVVDCAKIGAFSSVWTMIALSMVIRRPIRSVYPAVHGEKALTFRTLNTVFNETTEYEPLTIMWSSMNKISATKKSKKTVNLNHFVAVSSCSVSSEQVENQNSSSVKQEQKTMSPTTVLSYAQSVNRSLKETKSVHVSPIISDQHSPGRPDRNEVPKSSTKRRLEEDTTTESIKLTTSTPNLTAEKDWKTPKRRRKDSDGCEDASFETSNRFENLSNLDSEDVPFVSDPDTFAENLYDVRNKKKKKNKHKNVHLSNLLKHDQSISTEDDSDLYINDRINRREADENSSDSDHDTTDDVSGQVPVNAPHRGRIVHGKFLSTQEVMELLQDDNGSLKCIPAGKKENMYFKIDNKENEQRQNSGIRREFWDDCGAWCKSASPSTYILVTGGQLVHLTKKQGKFGIEKRGKQIEFLDPQPDMRDMIIINRSYSKLKANNMYKRRISWVGNKPDDFATLLTNVAIVEYIGKFPGRGMHGNGKYPEKKQPYIKAKPAMKKKATTLVQHDSAKMFTTNSTKVKIYMKYQEI